MTTTTEIKRPSADTIKSIFRALTTCPATGQVVKRDDGEPFAIPDGQAVWWHCSACGGWHASLSEPEQH